jgi:hypothetical protein
MTHAAGECSAGGLLISGALAIRSCLVGHGDVSTAYVVCGFRKSIAGAGRGGWSTLLGPEETGTGWFFRLVLVVFRSPLSLSRRVGGVGSGVRAGPASIPRLFPLFAGFGWFGGGVGWCPFVF